MPKTKKEVQSYAIYRGDKFVFVGTKQECADHLKVKPSTIYFLSTEVHRRRTKSENALLTIKLSDE